MIFEPEFYDAASQPPRVALAVDRVGISGQRVEVAFVDPLFGTAQALLDVAAGCSLEPSQRGIHMSRVEEVLLTPRAPASLACVAFEIADELRATQHATMAWVSVEGDVAVCSETPATGRPVRDTVRVSVAVMLSADSANVTTALTATNITACPCMQAYALDDLARTLDLDPQLARDLGARVPIATHTQRGRVRLEVVVKDRELAPSYLALHEIIGASTVLTVELLKRPDEYHVVRAAHLRPQFVEDVVRDVLAGAATRLAEVDDDALITVRAEAFESIHGHDVMASSTRALGALRQLPVVENPEPGEAAS